MTESVLTMVRQSIQRVIDEKCLSGTSTRVVEVAAEPEYPMACVVLVSSQRPVFEQATTAAYQIQLLTDSCESNEGLEDRSTQVLRLFDTAYKVRVLGILQRMFPSIHVWKNAGFMTSESKDYVHNVSCLNVVETTLLELRHTLMRP